MQHRLAASGFGADMDGSNLPAKQVWEEVLTGVYKYRSKSGVSAHGVHYSCDPDKDPDTPDGLAWRDDLAATYPGGIDGFMWRQHMEIDFEAVSGEVLFPNWDITTRNAIVAPMPRAMQANWQYYSGFDYGKRNLTCWYIIGLYVDGDGDLIRRVMLGLEGTGDALGAHKGISEKMQAHPLFSYVNGRIQADPTMWNKNQSISGGYRSMAQLFAEEGVHLVPAKINGQDADDILIERLKYNYWSDPDKPLLLIENTCIQMIRQFKGLRYKEWTPATRELHSLQEVLVDRANDSFDALKYAEVSRPSPSSRKRSTTPAPSPMPSMHISAGRWASSVALYRATRVPTNCIKSSPENRSTGRSRWFPCRSARAD